VTPRGPKDTAGFSPRLIAWEVTRSCNLDCAHCRAAASRGPYTGELTTEEGIALLEDIASRWRPIIIFTGGDPIMRHDLFTLIAKGRDLGLPMVISPNGTLLTPGKVRALRELGILRASISIDGPDAESHDAFRRVKGAFEGALRGIAQLKAEGLPFQVNTTITRHNVAVAEKIYDLAVSLGAVAWHPFLLVPTGRGAELAPQAIEPREYEEALRRFYRIHCEGAIPLKVTCAPHFARIAREEEAARKAAGLPVKEIDMSRGCLAGIGFAFVSHVGRVQTCGYLDVECGDVRRQPFTEIWDTSPVFVKMRAKEAYGGRCGACPYWRFCGGCRARAFEATGDYMAEETHCIYVPPGYHAQP